MAPDKLDKSLTGVAAVVGSGGPKTGFSLSDELASSIGGIPGDDLTRARLFLTADVLCHLGERDGERRCSGGAKVPSSRRSCERALAERKARVCSARSLRSSSEESSSSRRTRFGDIVTKYLDLVVGCMDGSVSH